MTRTLWRIVNDQGEKRYWKSPDARDDGSPGRQPASDARAIVEALDVRPDRRDFLKTAGFVLAGSAACSRAPVEQAIPFLVQPEEITPGRSLFYASTCGACPAGCGLLVKNRDGRPIKLEGNPDHPVSRGGLCAIGQASLLGLYDSHRFQSPLRNGEPATWEDVDTEILERLAGIRDRGGAVRVLTSTVTSPTVRHLIDGFLDSFSDARHVAYDPLSSSAMLDAHERTHGRRVLPRYHFEHADVIVSFDADFLGTWISPVEFTAGYRAGRTLDGDPPHCSWHVQFESVMSLTGASADERVRIAPGDLGGVVAGLAARIAARAGTEATGDPAPSPVLDRVADRLWQGRGRSLVVSGSQDVSIQEHINLINHLLDNYGATLDLDRPSWQRAGDDRALESLVGDLRGRRIAALFVAGVNPAYDLAWVPGLSEALESVPLLVSLAERPDETSALARYVCPDRHYLESWMDAEPVAGVVSLTQPVAHPLGDTRPLIESLARWTNGGGSAYDLIREQWEAGVFPRRPEAGVADEDVADEIDAAADADEDEEDDDGTAFRDFWDRAVHDGFVEVRTPPAGSGEFQTPAPGSPAGESGTTGEDRFSLVLYPKVAIRDGRHAYNAWLQELPDPISKVTWDNYACLSTASAARLRVADGDLVRVALSTDPDGAIELPAFAQPGQHDGVVAIALGYGGRQTERFTNVGPRWFQARPTAGPDGRVGTNASRFLTIAAGTVRYAGALVTVTRSQGRRTLASTQDHHTITVPERLAPAGAARRTVVQETTLPAYQRDPGAGAPDVHHPESDDLWPQDHEYPGPRWGMVVDLNACTGCSACVVACQAENNVPVVGRDEVARHREMHWIRIDRYYSGDGDDVDVMHQPMMCQHCGNAPCEVVCPVLATVHSEEGLNQQVYNRCVGTRYCANNCPYKVRRFNWFDYPREDPVQNLVLNPDIVVRSRGVMEKCSLCVQRIQEAKIEARRLGGEVADGAIQTACQQSCPARAITFGDLKDPGSAVARLAGSPRQYQVLEELNVRPGVGYLRLVRNRADDGEAGRE